MIEPANLLAVDRVFREPLSGPEFPANREIYREFRGFGSIVTQKQQLIALNLLYFQLLNPI